jgi:hypothetical protein
MATVLECEVQQRAQFTLRNSPIHALRDIQVERVGERLVLSGVVSTFYLKQLAQEALRGMTQGLRLSNEIAVDA